MHCTHVFLQAGVGGMASGAIAGIAKYFKRIPKIIIVEPENADCVLKSIEKGSVTGMAVVIRDLIYLVVESSVISIIMSIILIGLITSIFFKRILWGVMAVIPLSVAVVINFGFMG